MKKQPSAFSLIEISVVIVIIGILVAGVTQGSRLIKQMRLSSAKTQTQSSAVSSIKNIVLWLEPTMDGSVTSPTNGTNVDDTDIVSSWNDYNPQLSVKTNATQSTSASRPSYVSNGINNLPSIRFDGTNDNLSITNVCTQNFTAFAVVKTAVAGTNGQGYQGRPILWGDRIVNNFDGVPLAIGGGFTKTFNGDPDSTLTGVRSVSNNNTHILVATRNMTSGARNIYVDGVADGSDSNGAPGTTLNDATTLLIGGNTINSIYFNGSIGEVIIFDRVLKAEERKSVEAYLGKKWGVEVN